MKRFQNRIESMDKSILDGLDKIYIMDGVYF